MALETTDSNTSHEDIETTESKVSLPIESSTISSLQNPNPNFLHLKSTPTILHLAFNQDASCFSVASTHGFRIYTTNPLLEIVRHDFSTSSGIGIVSMLFRCSIHALVGGGSEPQYPRNKVMIWDDHQSRCVGELSFRSEVKGVQLRHDRIVVILLQKLFVYNFENLKLLDQIETVPNPKGLCEISHVSGVHVLVCPGLQKGQVRVENYESRRSKLVSAHNSRISCLSLTQDGRLMATASSKGTLIRIFNCLDCTLLQEVRRGKEKAAIYSIAFSSDAQWLAASSGRRTVHVFNIKVESPRNAAELNLNPNSKVSSLSFMKGVLPKYFSSEWSVAQYRLHDDVEYIVAFGHERNTVLILGMDGSFYRCQFDSVVGGDMTQLEYCNFLKSEES